MTLGHDTWSAHRKIEMLTYRSTLHLTEEEEFALALENSRCDTGGPSNIVKPPEVIKYDYFLNTLTQQKHGDNGTNPKIAEFLKSVFKHLNTSNWTVINPHGDGFCSIAAVAFDRMTYDFGNKESHVEKLKPALVKYFMHADLKNDKSLFVVGGDEIAEFREGATKSNNSSLESMKSWSDISSNFFGVLAYAFNCNIIALSFDSKTEFRPIVTVYLNNEKFIMSGEILPSYASNWSIVINTSNHWRALSIQPKPIDKIKNIVGALIPFLSHENKNDVLQILRYA